MTKFVSEWLQQNGLLPITLTCESLVNGNKCGGLMTLRSSSNLNSGNCLGAETTETIEKLPRRILFLRDPTWQPRILWCLSNLTLISVRCYSVQTLVVWLTSQRLLTGVHLCANYFWNIMWGTLRTWSYEGDRNRRIPIWKTCKVSSRKSK